MSPLRAISLATALVLTGAAPVAWLAHGTPPQTEAPACLEPRGDQAFPTGGDVGLDVRVRNRGSAAPVTLLVCGGGARQLAAFELDLPARSDVTWTLDVPGELVAARLVHDRGHHQVSLDLSRCGPAGGHVAIITDFGGGSRTRGGDRGCGPDGASGGPDGPGSFGKALSVPAPTGVLP